MELRPCGSRRSGAASARRAVLVAAVTACASAAGCRCLLAFVAPSSERHPAALSPPEAHGPSGKWTAQLQAAEVDLPEEEPATRPGQPVLGALALGAVLGLVIALAPPAQAAEPEAAAGGLQIVGVASLAVGAAAGAYILNDLEQIKQRKEEERRQEEAQRRAREEEKEKSSPLVAALGAATVAAAVFGVGLAGFFVTSPDTLPAPPPAAVKPSEPTQQPAPKKAEAEDKQQAASKAKEVAEKKAKEEAEKKAKEEAEKKAKEEAEKKTKEEAVKEPAKEPETKAAKEEDSSPVPLVAGVGAAIVAVAAVGLSGTGEGDAEEKPTEEVEKQIEEEAATEEQEKTAKVEPEKKGKEEEKKGE